MDYSSPTDTARMYIGLLPDAGTRRLLQRWCDTWQWRPGTIRTRPERYHLTLHFLGEVPVERLTELANGLHVAFRPFTLCLGQAAIWNQGTAVLLPNGIPDELARLHAALKDALHARGFRSLRSTFTPHITLARKAAGSVKPAAPLALRRRVQSYALVRSDLSPPATYFVERVYRCESVASVRGQQTHLHID